MRGQSSQLVDGQSNQAKGVLKKLEVCAAHPEEAGSMDKHQRKMTEKGREYRKEILDKKRTNLVSRIIRKSSEIDVLLYSYQNNVTVKEELAQLSGIFRLIDDIHQEMTVSIYLPNSDWCLIPTALLFFYFLSQKHCSYHHFSVFGFHSY